MTHMRIRRRSSPFETDDLIIAVLPAVNAGIFLISTPHAAAG